MSIEKAKVWEGVYASFAEARAEHDVFEGATWLDKIEARARGLIALTQTPSTIAPVAVTSDYALPYVAALSARGDRPLRVLDFGGGAGTSFLPLVEMLPAQLPLEFHVIENEAVCKLGAELYAGDQRILFRDSLRDMNEVYDIVHCGSSLHYVDDWKGLLVRFAALRPQFMIFADLPAADNKTFVTVQLYYERRIPVRFWNLKEFCSFVESLGYEIVLKARYQGYYAQRGAELPTDHFEADHRLTYISQLIFRRAMTT